MAWKIKVSFKYTTTHASLRLKPPQLLRPAHSRSCHEVRGEYPAARAAGTSTNYRYGETDREDTGRHGGDRYDPTRRRGGGRVLCRRERARAPVRRPQ